MKQTFVANFLSSLFVQMLIDLEQSTLPAQLFIRKLLQNLKLCLEKNQDNVFLTTFLQ